MSEEITWYDDEFKVFKTRFGLFISELRDGKQIITAPTEESCVDMTRFYLKGLQDGFPEPLSSYSSVVGGKL